MSNWKNYLGKIIDGGKKFVSGIEDGSSGVFSQSDLPHPITIGKYNVHFTRKIDEGGFSYVYSAVDTQTNKQFAVKRLLIQDREQRAVVNNEIKVMKKIAGHPCLITLHGEKFDRINDNMVVWLLMELGEDSVIGLINKRLGSMASRLVEPTQTRNSPQFSERQILRIFYDVCCGISHMHSMQPPIIHRDLKIENVLKVGNIFKICDFGSCTTRFYDLDQKHERQLAEEDINKNTTMEYRAPEMIDLFSGNNINEKSDIWALGCLLYKLMFFQGPFDDDSGILIMSGKFDMPPKSFLDREQKFLRENPNVAFANYTKDLPKLVKAMLRTNPHKRPDIFELLQFVGNLLGIPEQDIPQPPQHIQSGGRGISSATNSPLDEQNSPDQQTENDFFGGKRGGRRKKNKNRGMRKKKKNVGNLYDELSKSTSSKKSTSVRRQQQQRKQVEKKVQEEWDPNFGEFDIPSSSAPPKKSGSLKKKDNSRNNESSSSSSSSTTTTTTDKKQPKGEEEEMDLFAQLDWHDSSASSTTTSKKSNKMKSMSPPSPRRQQRKKKKIPFSGTPQTTLRGQGPLTRNTRVVLEEEEDDDDGNINDDDDDDHDLFQEQIDDEVDDFGIDPMMDRNRGHSHTNNNRKQTRRPNSSPPSRRAQKKKVKPQQKKKSEEVSLEGLLKIGKSSDNNNNNNNNNRKMKKKVVTSNRNDSLIQFDAGPQGGSSSSSFRRPPSQSTLGLPGNIHPRTKSFDQYNLPRSLDRLYNQPRQQQRQQQQQPMTYHRAGFQPIHTNGYYRSNQQYVTSPGLVNPTRARQVSSDVAFIKQLVNQKKEEIRKSKSTDNFPF